MSLFTLEEFSHHIAISLTLVAAFAWNDAIKEFFDRIFISRKYGGPVKYALFVTLLVTIILGAMTTLHGYITRNKNTLEDKLDKSIEREMKESDITLTDFAARR